MITAPSAASSSTIVYDYTKPVPFSDRFLSEITRGERRQPPGAITNWIGSLIGKLQEWKEELIDDVARYEELISFLGADWTVSVGAQVRFCDVEFNRINKSSADPSTQSIRFRHAVHIIKLNAGCVPGIGSYADERERWLFSVRTVHCLLLTALDDLQTRPRGFFQNLLEGPVLSTRLTAEATETANESKGRKRHRCDNDDELPHGDTHDVAGRANQVRTERKDAKRGGKRMRPTKVTEQGEKNANGALLPPYSSDPDFKTTSGGDGSPDKPSVRDDQIEKRSTLADELKELKQKLEQESAKRIEAEAKCKALSDTISRYRDREMQLESEVAAMGGTPSKRDMLKDR